MSTRLEKFFEKICRIRQNGSNQRTSNGLSNLFNGLTKSDTSNDINGLTQN
jgi:hypothetical protein